MQCSSSPVMMMMFLVLTLRRGTYFSCSLFWSVMIDRRLSRVNSTSFVRWLASTVYSSRHAAAPTWIRRNPFT